MTICNNCTRQAHYNLLGEKPRYCSDHKQDNMINVTKKLCKDCDKEASYNFINKKAIYCSDHKQDDMINVTRNLCKDCDKQPSFNYPDEKEKIYCLDHKKDDMINLKNPKCKDCIKQPSFNYPEEDKAIYCFDHKKENMINVIKRRKCKDCTKLPSYNIKGENKALYCFDHKKDNMIDVKNARCVSCDLFWVKKRGEYCNYCNPDSTIGQKTKEMQIKKLLEINNIKFIHNKGVSNNCCLKYRPDFLIQCTTNDNIYYVVLEVDEFAHKGYDPDCEITRMNNISIYLGLPTKFLRYNPDLKMLLKKLKKKRL